MLTDYERILNAASLSIAEIAEAVTPLHLEKPIRVPKIFTPRQGFHLQPVGGLQYLEPEFVIEGVMEADCLAMIFGDPASGKSFAALDMAACVATGRNWKGRPTKAGPVIYLAGEGHNGIVRRLTAWTAHTGQSLVGVACPDRVVRFGC